MSYPVRLLTSFGFWLLVGGRLFAQLATGVPPFGSFSNGPDTIDNANLNSHLTIPVFHKAGRGLDFYYDLSYDSLVWKKVTTGGVTGWQPVTNFGWVAQTDAPTGVVEFTATSAPVSCNGKMLVKITDTNYVYHDQLGATHSIVGTSVGSPCPPGNIPLTNTTTDGSGFALKNAFGFTGSILSSGGKIILARFASGPTARSVTDANGNQISEDTSGNITDTLGTVALKVVGSAPSPVTISYTPPAGGTVAYTISYHTYTVQTHFVCTGVSDYGATSTSLVDRITLPDGTFYQFYYEGTPGFPSSVTGRLASVATPTGGTITYTYSGGNSGIICADGSTAGLTRTLNPGGQWLYSRSIGTGAASTTTVTDPQSNVTVVQFQGIYETQRQAYQGAVSPSNLLLTVNSCYNLATAPCTGTAITLPITQKAITTQLGTSGFQAKRVVSYNNLGLQTEVDQYDYATGTPTVLLRKTLTTYNTSLGNGILNKIASQTVQDGSATVLSETNINYDETAVVAPPNTPTPQHVTVTGSRGNPTTVKSFVQGTTTLNKTTSYYDTGIAQTTTDINLATTTNNFASLAGSCGNAFPTSVSEPLGLSKSFTWNCLGGVLASTIDENGMTVNSSYSDPYFWRPASITDQTTALTNFTYSTNPMAVERSLTFNAGASTVDILTIFDGLGRPILTQKRQAPGSVNFDIVETDYDSFGRPNRSTLPYNGTSGQKNPSGPAKTELFDALGRVTQVSDAGGGQTTYTYSPTNNDLLVTVGPPSAGENTKRRQLQYDGVGRLTSVCEITTGALSGTCGQSTAQTSRPGRTITRLARTYFVGSEP